VLVTNGYQVIERINVVDADGTPHAFEWAAAADDAWWLDDGRLVIDGEVLSITSIEVEPSATLAEVEAHITDIAPTAALALGIPAPAQATGHPLAEESASHVLLLFLDGFGYMRYREALEAGLIPNLSALGPPLLGLTTYPPITAVSSASLLTGAPPAVHGADRRGIRKTEIETLFDVATGAGLDVVAVEGEALAFALRGAEFTLSGDRDGNGSTDDNVLANTLSVLAEGMPDLLYVHFHGIDDAGHSYGPGAVEEEEAIRGVDQAVGQILEAVPPDTLVIIFADHGMHRVDEAGRLGNHGHLIARDMFIPIFVHYMEE
jgi:predicted AlkP superfamily pyrophosphatase or phosphodiesterase